MRQNVLRKYLISLLAACATLNSPASAAPYPRDDASLHPKTQHIVWIQIVGEGRLWNKVTGISQEEDIYRSGILMTDRRTISSLFGCFRFSGGRVKIPKRSDPGSIFVMFYDTPPPPPNSQDEETTMMARMHAQYLRAGPRSFLLADSNRVGQYMAPGCGGRFEAIVRGAARRARRHRGDVRFFRFPGGEFGAS